MDITEISTNSHRKYKFHQSSVENDQICQAMSEENCQFWEGARNFQKGSWEKYQIQRITSGVVLSKKNIEIQSKFFWNCFIKVCGAGNAI